MDVTIILGSKSDLPVAEKATGMLDRFGLDYELRIGSAHRTPAHVESIVSGSDAPVFITAAGLSAALPGVVASLTTRPVIGIPVSGKVPYDSLLSIAQMPPGIPVACVGVDRADNAALLAISILATSRPELFEKLEDYRNTMREKVLADDTSVQPPENMGQ